MSSLMPIRVNWAGMSCTSSIDCNDMDKLPMKFDIRVVKNIMIYTEILLLKYLFGIRLALFYFMTGIF